MKELTINYCYLQYDVYGKKGLYLTWPNSTHPVQTFERSVEDGEVVKINGFEYIVCRSDPSRTSTIRYELL